MLKYEKGNIVTGNWIIFCHQVNCKGVMGAGLAKQIKDKYPEVYKEYLRVENPTLGIILPVFTHDGRACINMFAQDGYGRDKRYTDYDAFKKCLDAIESFLKSHHVHEDVQIAFPYGIGCGLAGGDWKIVLCMLNEFANNIKQDVVIVNYV